MDLEAMEQETCLFNRAVRMKVKPTLIETAEVEWPWPASSDVPPGSETSSSLSEAYPLTRAAREYASQNPTQVLSLTSDGSATNRSRRIAVVLSAGRRPYLPVMTLSPRTPVLSSRVRWEFPDRDNFYTPSASPVPLVAEVVVGRMSAVLGFAEQLRRTWTDEVTVKQEVSHKESECQSPPPKSSRSQRHGSEWPDLEKRRTMYRSTPPCNSFLLASPPYKVLWLQNGKLLLSLSCEERLLTLDASPTTPASSSAFCGEVGSFSLPGGVVPLDMVELSGRSSIAVGTVDHGALLCGLSSDTGEVLHILRHISVSGFGSAVFPVCKIAAILPAVQSLSEAADVNDGVLLLSSPYEVQPAFVRLGQSGNGDGTMEECPTAMNAVHEVFSTQSYSEVDPQIGVVVCTAKCVFTLEFTGVSTGNQTIACRKRFRTVNEDQPVTRTCDGFPVYLHGDGVYKPKNTRTWCFMADAGRTIHLIERGMTFLPRGSITLRPPDSADDDEREPSEVAPARSAPDAADTITGLVLIHTEDGVMVTAAAHSRRYISIVKWD